MRSQAHPSCYAALLSHHYRHPSSARCVCVTNTGQCLLHGPLLHFTLPLPSTQFEEAEANASLASNMPLLILRAVKAHSVLSARPQRTSTVSSGEAWGQGRVPGPSAIETVLQALRSAVHLLQGSTGKQAWLHMSLHLWDDLLAADSLEYTVIYPCCGTHGCCLDWGSTSMELYYLSLGSVPKTL